MQLSRRAKEALKTALAMVLAYGIALQMDWDKPQWAGFAVAMISLPTVGHSLDKGMQRMLGTLNGILFSLLLVALFPQQRWLFLLTLSLFFGLCAYQMGGEKRAYFWFVSGLVTALISLASGFTSVGAFELAMLRGQETGLGILTYTLISVFIWPVSARQSLNSVTVQWIRDQHQLFLCSLSALTRQQPADQYLPQLFKSNTAETQFGSQLSAALIDTYQIDEQRSAWRRFQQQATQLTDAIMRWQQTTKELSQLDLPLFLPNFNAYTQAISQQFTLCRQVVEKQIPAKPAPMPKLSLNEAVIASESHFNQAALLACYRGLNTIGRLAGAQVETVNRLCTYSSHAQADDMLCREPRAKSTVSNLKVVDLERLTAALRIGATLWIAFLVIIYLNDLPGGVTFLIMTGALGLIMATQPQLPVTKLFPAVFGSALVINLLYIFVMPKLTGFVELGSLIGVVTFMACYLFSQPKQALARNFSLTMFLVLSGIDNQQSYSFQFIADTTLMFFLVLLLLCFAAHIPVSPRPERWFERLLKRFFRSCDHVLLQISIEPPARASWIQHYRNAFHCYELTTLPGKLQGWLPQLAGQQLQGVVYSTQLLAKQTLELQAIHRRSQVLGLKTEWRNDLDKEIKAWRQTLHLELSTLSQLAPPIDTDALRHSHRVLLSQLESRIKQLLDMPTESSLNSHQGFKLYRLLNAYRGYCAAVLSYAEYAADINWEQWRETRL